jgi:hypothetical protein
MLHLGYEALCVSRSSLSNWNPSERWQPAFGHNIVEFLGAGLPAIPRHVLAQGQDDTYRLAAFLDQPIIPHGHHKDCAGNLDLLGRVAALINGFGDVRWMGLTALSRSNYRCRREDSTLMVQMLGRKVVLPALDPEVKRIVACRPWMGATEEMFACRQADTIRHVGLQPRFTREIAVSGPGPIRLESTPATVLNPEVIAPPSRRIWPVLRRVAAESRDRLSPLLSPHAHPVP